MNHAGIGTTLVLIGLIVIRFLPFCTSYFLADTFVRTWQAYKEGIFGRKYQWILGAYNDRWWKSVFREGHTLECTESELLDALDGYISIDVLPLSSSKEITASGMVCCSVRKQ